jgi:nitrogen regulatory protein P-II 2
MIMKLIIAIIQPHKLEAVKNELEAVDVNLMTVTNVLGQGRQKGHTEIYRGAKEAGGLLNKVRLDIAVNEDFVEPTIAAINKGARTGGVGDGKIFVVDLRECIRISSGERGSEAIG